MMNSETTSLKADSSKMEMQIERKYSYTTLARLIGSADSKPNSPATPSPREAMQMKKVVQRLEEIDAESRELLQTLFSMLEKDSRLEKYVQRRLKDPKVSRMWEIVEHILATHHGNIDVDAMLNKNNKNHYVDEDETHMMLRELKIEGEIYDDEDEMRLQRFKIRTLDIADVVEDRE